MAAIWAGRTAQKVARPLRIRVLDGAVKLGAKILVSGGGRCNVTHERVSETAYSGSTPPAIRNVLRRFDVPQTIEFFEEMGVRLKREETGKLFPVSDRARTVLDALLQAAREAGVVLQHPARVEHVQRMESLEHQPHPAYLLSGTFGTVSARRVILATGGRSLPKTGSDGAGYAITRSLGHSTTSHIFPALVPLVLDSSCFIRELSGLTIPATLELRLASGKRLIAFTDSTLCTHFGLSGPGVLDISRHYLSARLRADDVALFINWLPGESPQSLDQALIEFARRQGSAGVVRFFADRLPQRLAKALCKAAGVDPSLAAHSVSREQRRSLVTAATNLKLPVTGDRGFAVAEVTAGGIPLKQVRLETMESRMSSGLHLCGEICDVDGRIGGYNFQWAWSSGFVAGTSAAMAILGDVAGREVDGN
ncbi:MAG: aminoacetone oxidase family FAD-binding enzyme [Phycisphaerae bacterium]|nr:aminoacetone oxidase family FAD-binding enzyme [Phycisphaerae bacterium]